MCVCVCGVLVVVVGFHSPNKLYITFALITLLTVGAYCIAYTLYVNLVVSWTLSKRKSDKSNLFYTKLHTDNIIEMKGNAVYYTIHSILVIMLQFTLMLLKFLFGIKCKCTYGYFVLPFFFGEYHRLQSSMRCVYTTDGWYTNIRGEKNQKNSYTVLISRASLLLIEFFGFDALPHYPSV